MLEGAGLLDPAISMRGECDVFIRHAGEQKGIFASHLSVLLRAAGFRAFLDEEDLQAGYDATAMMDTLCLTAPICVMVLSEEYFKSKWCCREAAIFAERRNRWKSAMEGPMNAEIQRVLEILRLRGLEIYDVSYPLIIPVFFSIDPSGVPFSPGVKNVHVRIPDRSAGSAAFTARKELREALGSITGIRRHQSMLDIKLVEDIVSRLQKVGLRTLREVQLSSVSTSDILNSDLVEAQMVSLPLLSASNAP